MRAVSAGMNPMDLKRGIDQGKGAFGYGAATETWGDLIEKGIIDPAKVTRMALQNATSVVSLMITTEAMVSELPAKRKRDHGHDHNHDDMDF